VVTNPSGRPYLFDGDRPKFSFFWTRHPLHYDDWPRTLIVMEDCIILILLDIVPRRLSTVRSLQTQGS